MVQLVAVDPIVDVCQVGSAKNPLNPPPLIDAPVSLPHPEHMGLQDPESTKFVAPTARTFGSEDGNSGPKVVPSGLAPLSPVAKRIVKPCAESAASRASTDETNEESN